MGAETSFQYSTRPRVVPSRISNCGEMVAESVLEQMEEEMLLEEMAVRDQQHSPGGRKLLVGMKLNASCREMLAWTIVELARPGDHILAFHVSSYPMHSAKTSRGDEAHFEHHANILRGFLAVYEGLCNLKQIKLEVEILPGVNVKKILVEFARSHRTCKLILGSNKHFTVGRNKSLGKYCLKRLPCTCTVVVLQQGEIILNEKGNLRTDLSSIGAGMLTTLRKSMRSFGRSKKVMNGGGSDEGSDDQPRPSEDLQLTFMELRHGERSIGYIDHSTELEKCYFSDSSLLLFASSIMPSSKVEILESRSDMFILQDHNGTQTIAPAAKSLSAVHASPSYNPGDSEVTPVVPEEILVPGWPLMHHTIGFDIDKPVKLSLADHPSSDRGSPGAPSPQLCLNPVKKTKSGPSSVLHRDRFSDKVTSTAPCPLHRLFSDKKITAPNRIKDLSKSRAVLSEEVYAKILGEIARDAFRGENGVMEEISAQASVDLTGSKDLYRADKKVQFALNVPKSELDDVLGGGNILSLAQRLDSLCLDRKLCTTFVYEELESATSNFSSSNVVGRGGGSEVYKGRMPDGRLVAVKRLNCGPQAEEELLNDVGINTSLSHPHIVAMLGYCVDSSHLILVYDYLPEGNLEDRLRHAPGTIAPVLPWCVRYKVAVGIAKALNYLHHGTSRPVIHRDVKASNILLTADFESKLSDFGLAKWAPKKAPHILCDDILGTFGYLAPEYFMYGRVNNKTDVYAFGIVLLELITGQAPIDNSKPKGHENLVNWARPLLEENDLDKLVDPRLKGVYDLEQMKKLLLAASLCVRQSSQRRPRMIRVLQILCSNHCSKLQNMHTRHEKSMSMDLEEGDSNIELETPMFGGCTTTDIQTHLALAMLGVDDDLISHTTLQDQHSSKYVENYVEANSAHQPVSSIEH